MLKVRKKSILIFIVTVLNASGSYKNSFI